MLPGTGGGKSLKLAHFTVVGERYPVGRDTGALRRWARFVSIRGPADQMV